MHHPPTKKAVNKAFKDYLDDFMRLFLDDFIIFSNLDAHLSKLWKCFEKCREYGISLNLDKCAFMVFSGMIFKLHSLKGGEAPRSKEGGSDSKNARSKKPSQYSNLQRLSAPQFFKNKTKQNP